MSPHLGPMLVNATTNEPFLRLPHPHSNIILTPPRIIDAEAIVPILNDKRVHKWLEGPPFPYLLEHARQWLEVTIKGAESTLRELQEHPGELVGGCPVRTLREVKENGEEIFLGDCGVDRYGWPEIEEKATREKMTKVNEARAVGDPEIVWDIGYYLKHSHHGKGIMTAALKTVIEEWMVPRMGVKILKGVVFKGNKGSVRVFEKNGLVLERTLEDWKAVPESKGGGKIGIHVLSRRM